MVPWPKGPSGCLARSKGVPSADSAICRMSRVASDLSPEKSRRDFRRHKASARDVPPAALPSSRGVPSYGRTSFAETLRHAKHVATAACKKAKASAPLFRPNLPNYLRIKRIPVNKYVSMATQESAKVAVVALVQGFSRPQGDRRPS